jgi:oligopeptide transport system ATP-binding protein
VGLLGAIPRLDQDEQALVAIPGAPPNMSQLSAGCPFNDRCAFAVARCNTARPALVPAAHNPAVLRACHKSLQDITLTARAEEQHV